MAWLDGWLLRESTPWMHGRLRDDISPAGNDFLSADASYVNLVLRAVHLGSVRKGTRRYYGMVSCTSTLVSEDAAAGGVSSFTAVSAPESLKALDPQHLDRVAVSGTRLLGPRPYRGGDLAVEIALLSVREADLAEPFLSLLTSVADVAGVGLLKNAMQLAHPLINGVNDLLQRSAAELETGAALTWQAPRAGTYVVTRYDARQIAPEQVSLTGDYRLLDPSGNPMVGPYLVFTIESSGERPDWHAIPDISAAWEDLRATVRRGRHDDVDEAFAVLRRTAVFNADLLPIDGERLVAKAQALVALALPAGRTSAGNERLLPKLSDVQLYG
jgi:hypothetical protein